MTPSTFSAIVTCAVFAAIALWLRRAVEARNNRSTKRKEDQRLRLNLQELEEPNWRH